MGRRKQHPFVSESQEGKPWFEWLLAAMVLLACAAVFFRYTAAGTFIIAGTSIVSAIIRLVMRDKSLWKVRSAGFDSFISLSLGVGLIITYISIMMIS